MRRARVKEPGRACYHVMNRVIGKEFLFSDEAKEEFVRIMREVEAFSGVQVLTYCIMTNHFHLLLQVHDPETITDEELLKRYERLAAPITFSQFKGMWDRFVEQKSESGLKMLRNKLLARMNDLSAFMQELKQRFTRWYNLANNRAGGGTFWSDRYKSVLVEGRCKALTTVATYIDLNPVRASLVTDPKNYRWCGYSAALAGVKKAREGMREIVKEFVQIYGRRGKKPDVFSLYRLMMFGKLEKKNPGRVTPEEIAEAFKAQGMVAPWVIAHHRIRWMSEGLVIGGKHFVNRQADKWSERLKLRRPKGRQAFPDEPDPSGNAKPADPPAGGLVTLRAGPPANPEP